MAGELTNPVFNMLIRKRQQMVDALAKERQAEFGVLNSAATGANTQAEGALDKYEQLIRGGSGAPLLPVQEAPGALQILGPMLAAHVSSMLSGNPAARNEFQGGLLRDQQQREATTEKNVGFQREDLKQQHTDLMAVQFARYQKLASRAEKLGNLRDATMYGDKATKLADAMKALQEAEDNAASDAGETQRANIRADADRDVAKARLDRIGMKEGEMSEEEYTKYIQKVLTDNMDKSGKVKNPAALKLQLLMAKQAGDTLDSWTARMLGMKQGFNSKDKKDLALLRSFAQIHFADEYGKREAEQQAVQEAAAQQAEVEAIPPGAKRLIKEAHDLANKKVSGGLRAQRVKQIEQRLREIGSILQTQYGLQLQLEPYQMKEIEVRP